MKIFDDSEFDQDDILGSTREGTAFGRGMLAAGDHGDPCHGEDFETQLELAAFARGFIYMKFGFDPGPDDDYLSFLVLMTEIQVEAA